MKNLLNESPQLFELFKSHTNKLDRDPLVMDQAEFTDFLIDGLVLLFTQLQMANERLMNLLGQVGGLQANDREVDPNTGLISGLDGDNDDL